MNRYLFITRPSNDLGLLAQSLPIARELKEIGHQIAFYRPAGLPVELIADTGFANLLPRQPLYDLISGTLHQQGPGKLYLPPVDKMGDLMIVT